MAVPHDRLINGTYLRSLLFWGLSWSMQGRSQGGAPGARPPKTENCSYNCCISSKYVTKTCLAAPFQDKCLAALLGQGLYIFCQNLEILKRPGYRVRDFCFIIQIFF